MTDERSQSQSLRKNWFQYPIKFHKNPPCSDRNKGPEKCRQKRQYLYHLGLKSVSLFRYDVKLQRKSRNRAICFHVEAADPLLLSRLSNLVNSILVIFCGKMRWASRKQLSQLFVENGLIFMFTGHTNYQKPFQTKKEHFKTFRKK